MEKGSPEVGHCGGASGGGTIHFGRRPDTIRSAASGLGWETKWDRFGVEIGR